MLNFFDLGLSKGEYLIEKVTCAISLVGIVERINWVIFNNPLLTN